MKTTCFPSSPMSHIPTKPPHPQKLHLLRVRKLGCGSNVSNICMEDTEDTGVPIWVTFLWILFIFMGQNHYIGMCARVYRVLSTSHIICSIVESNDFVPVYTIVDKRYATSFVVCEIVIFSLEFLTEDLGEKVVFKSSKKILMTFQRHITRT
jgi:hypothetical protein